jgi:hypothetical protein
MIKFSCSIAGLVPSIGLQLDTRQINNLNTYYRDTGSNSKRWAICQECGRPFIYSTFSKFQTRKFCSCACSNRYSGRIRTELKQKLLSKYAKKPEMAEFYKQYNQIVRNYIYGNFDPDYREDLFDYWQDNAVYAFYKIYTYEKKMKRKVSRFAFLKKLIEFGFLEVKREKYKEIFYDECPIKAQYAILGEYTEKE